MRTYIIKRLLAIVSVLLLLSVLVFLVIYLIPGDPVQVMLGDNANPQLVQQMRTQMGLDLPLVQQYFRWFGRALGGDLGTSYFLSQPVLKAVGEHLVPTLSLTVFAELIAVIIAIPFGILAAVHKGKWADRLLTGYSLFGVSVPGFLLSLFLILLFAVRLRWLPVAGYVTVGDGLSQYLRFLILPAFSIAVVISSNVARITRASMLQVLGQDYIRTSRALGIPDKVLIFRYCLKNAMIPIITVIGNSFGTLIAGAAVVETIFNIPGIGQLLVNSVTRRDYPVIQGVILLIAAMNVMIYFITDLLYALIDPRVRYTNK